MTNLSLTYDAMGNITSRSDVAGGAAWSYHPSKKHALLQAGSASYTYTYDANGNAITRNGYSITWSSYNYPTVINGAGKSMTFSYDANRNRIRQVYTNGSTTETTQYVDGILEKVTTGSGTDWRHYVKAGDQIVAIVSRTSSGTNTTRYILEDHQHSVSRITDNAGASIVGESFTAFGQRQGPCPCTDLQKITAVTRKGYTGQDSIGGISMGLVHMNGRVQDAITGRFLSADPYVSNPGDTQNYNRYSYALNNPMSYIDPTGFDIESEMETVKVLGQFMGTTAYNYFLQLYLIGLEYAQGGLIADFGGGGDSPDAPKGDDVPTVVVDAQRRKDEKCKRPDDDGQIARALADWQFTLAQYMPDLPSLPDGVVNFSAGLGDGLLLGAGDPVREFVGIDGGWIEARCRIAPGAGLHSHSALTGSVTPRSPKVFRSSLPQAQQLLLSAPHDAPRGRQCGTWRSTLRMTSFAPRLAEPTPA